MIIGEREVNLESLSHTFIPEVFRDRTWTSLLTIFGNVCDPQVREFFSNAIVEEDHLNYCVRGTKFTISPSSIQNLLQICLVTPKSFLPYDDRRNRIAEAIANPGGKQKCQTI